MGTPDLTDRCQHCKQTDLRDVARAVAEAYTPEGQAIWWRSWADNPNQRRAAEAGVLQEWSRHAAAGLFDAPRFFAAIDATRHARRLKFRQVAQQAGISPSTLTRLSQGKRPDVDTLAALVTWAGVSADQFITRPGGAA